jgi:hypothetical protein
MALLVQIKAGREGISLHDGKGSRQRILMNLGLLLLQQNSIQVESED